MSRPTSDRAAQARAAAHETRHWIHRRRFGTPGAEPPEGRNPIHHWGSLALAIVATLASFTKAVELGAGLALVCFALGAPRAWTWHNDRISSLTWTVGAAMLVVGQALLLFGDRSIRQTGGSGRQPGAAAILIAFSTLVAAVGYYRRWGTAGNTAYWDLQMKKGDLDAIASAQEYGERSGLNRAFRERDDD